jgi:hypothetical protein
VSGGGGGVVFDLEGKCEPSSAWGVRGVHQQSRRSVGFVPGIDHS